jgi:4'-phosphopantetheinyl transferase
MPSDLSACELHLYLLPLAGINSSQSELLLRCLNDDEQAKITRYQPKSRNNALIVRAALRHVLSLHGAFLANEWQFDYGKQGKPELTAAQYAQTGINFNLSHSGDWLLIGVLQAPAKSQRSALGVDIERRRESTNIHTILKRYFAAPEISDLLVLDTAKQRDRFFDLWALKESYIKACGQGLAMALTSFSFDINAACHLQNSAGNGDNTSSSSSLSNSSQGPKIYSLSLEKIFHFDSSAAAESIDYSPAQQAVMTRLNQTGSRKEALDDLAESQLTSNKQLDWLSVPLQLGLNAVSDIEQEQVKQELEQAESGTAVDNSWYSYLAQLDEQYRIGVSVSL